MFRFRLQRPNPLHYVVPGLALWAVILVPFL
jgi:hypothetical protein